MFLPLPSRPTREQHELSPSIMLVSVSVFHGSAEEPDFSRSLADSRLFFLPADVPAARRPTTSLTSNRRQTSKPAPPLSRARSALFSVHSVTRRAERAAFPPAEQSALDLLRRLSLSAQYLGHRAPDPRPIRPFPPAPASSSCDPPAPHTSRGSSRPRSSRRRTSRAAGTSRTPDAARP